MKFDVINGQTIITFEKGEQATFAFTDKKQTIDVTNGKNDIIVEGSEEANVEEVMTKGEAYDRWLTAFEILAESFIKLCEDPKHREHKMHPELHISSYDMSLHYYMPGHNDEPEVCQKGAYISRLPDYDFLYLATSASSIFLKARKRYNIESKYASIYTSSYYYITNEIRSYLDRLKMQIELGISHDQIIENLAQYVDLSKPASEQLIQQVLDTERQCIYVPVSSPILRRNLK